MKKLIIPTLFLFGSPAVVNANESHHFAVGVNYHLDQKSAPGYQAAYQWQFSETFEFDTRLVASNDISITNDNGDIVGDYSRFSIGANFIKRYNDDLSIKAGTGLGFVLSSSNKTLIKNSAMAPYFMLAFNYQVSNNISLELGQFSHFNSEIIDTNHSLYFNVGIKFGQSNRLFGSHQRSEPTKTVSHEVSPVTKPSTLSIQAVTPTQVAMTAQKPAPMPNSKPNYWYVQFGAYNNLVNAQQALVKLQGTAPQLSLSVVKDNQYYRVLSKAFESKQRADDHASMINSQHSLPGYVTQIEK